MQFICVRCLSLYSEFKFHETRYSIALFMRTQKVFVEGKYEIKSWDKHSRDVSFNYFSGDGQERLVEEVTLELVG